jgi:hypothetical protein
MPGGLMQLVNKGAQDHLVTGQPSFTHFRSVYKRHTEFAMEHYVLNFRGVNLDLLPQNSKTLRAKVDRNAQLIHDCYVNVTIPDIYSPVNPIGTGFATGYEFQWIPNLGYNMIKQVSLLINGTAVVTHTGEWMKMYSYLLHDTNTRTKIDRMVGNVPELMDPANAYGKHNQYPHSISTRTSSAAQSILGRELIIPLHFWFCEDVGSSLPLIALQYSEVEIVVEFRSIYELFTVKDVNPLSPTYQQRIKPDLTNALYSMNKFLSPPNVNTSPVNPSLLTWSLQPYIQATYIFLSDPEMLQLAKSDTSFMIKDLRPVVKHGVYGPANDIELTMVNLCTRLVWTAQRSDILANNGFDNYTNWIDKPAITTTGLSPITSIYSSGLSQASDITRPDTVVEATLVFDGANREDSKTKAFYDLLQNYKHHTGLPLPGVYTYSFALDHHTKQPSGHANGSMFNKTILRLSTLDPPIIQGNGGTELCVLKSTALNRNPTVVSPANHHPDEVVHIYSKNISDTRPYTYTVTVYVESYNFLRVTHGMANVVFSS